MTDWDWDRWERVVLGEEPHGVTVGRRLWLAFWHGQACARAPGLREHPLSARIGHGLREGREIFREPQAGEMLAVMERDDLSALPAVRLFRRMCGRP